MACLSLSMAKFDSGSVPQPPKVQTIIPFDAWQNPSKTMSRNRVNTS